MSRTRRTPRRLSLIMLVALAAAAIATPGALALSGAAKPELSGIARVGQQLSATDGTFTTEGTETGWIVTGRDWLRCPASGALEACTQIDGAAGNAYSLTVADLGKKIRHRTRASGLIGVVPSGSAESVSDPYPQSGTVRSDPSVEVLPAVSGTPIDGATLTVSGNQWSGTTSVTFSYRWQRCETAGSPCSPASVASPDPAYVLSAADVGKRMRVDVIGTNQQGSLPASSPLSAVIAPRPPPPPDPPADLKRLRPFPTIVLAGRLSRARTLVTELSVRAPRGARVAVRCVGRGVCPLRRTRARRSRGRRLRIRALERRYGSGAKLEIRITKPGRIGKFTRFTFRRNRTPSRRDLCLRPGLRRPVRCGSV